MTINWEELSNSEIINAIVNREAHQDCCNITDNDICALGDLVMTAVGMQVAGLKHELTRFAQLCENDAVESAIYEVYA